MTARRIAYLFPNAELGGAELATLEILAAHDRERYEPFAFLLEDGPVAERAAGRGIAVRVSETERPSLRDLRGVRNAREWIETQFEADGIDLQHNVMAWMHALAGPVGRTRGIPVVWYQHTPPGFTSRIDWLAALTRADAVLVNSRYTRSRQRRLNLLRQPVTVISPPVAGPTGEPDRSLRRALSEPGDLYLVAVVARLQRPKGQHVAIEALARLQNKRATRLLLFGSTAFGLDEGYGAQLEELARRRGVAGRVSFPGFEADRARIYGALDLLLVPSLEPEGFGLAAAEALAHGVPVIASRTGALGEIIEHGVNGLLVPPGDAARLAQAIDDVLADPDRLRPPAGCPPPAFDDGAAVAARLETLYDRLAGPCA